MKNQRRQTGTSERPSQNGSAKVDALEIAEIGAMMLLRARQFKNNPHSGLRAGDVFMTRLDTHGGTWSVGETGMDENTSEACIVVTHDENDFQARAARYAKDKLEPKFGATRHAIRVLRSKGDEVPDELKNIYEEQKAQMEQLQAQIDAKATHRWVFKNTDPLPPIRTI